MQRHYFTHNVYVLNLDLYDLIIGVDWMKAYRPITFDFRSLQLCFDNGGERVCLFGEGSNTDTLLQKESNDLKRKGELLMTSMPLSAHSDSLTYKYPLIYLNLLRLCLIAIKMYLENPTYYLPLEVLTIRFPLK